MITLICDACGKKLQVRDEFAGQPGQCPACAFTLQIPYPDTFLDEAPVAARAVEVMEPEDARPAAPIPAAPVQGDEPLLDHGGGPLSAGADFFVPAPSEIGPVRSAHTTLRHGQEPVSMGTRLLIALLGIGLGAFVGIMIDAGAGVRSEFWRAFWPIVLGLIGFVVAMAVTGFTHTCSYIAQDGVARFVCSGSRDNLKTQEVFRFRDATDLRTSTTHHYTNGVYQNTAYTYTWTDVGGRTHHVISGSHTSEAGTPPTADAYNYARGAETAWTVYLLDGAWGQVKRGHTVLFNLTGGQWIRLGEGLIVFSGGGQPEEWRADEVRAASVQKGVVRILRNDAQEGWFSSRGVFKFSFDQLANAQLFFHMLEKVVGVPVN